MKTTSPAPLAAIAAAALAVLAHTMPARADAAVGKTQFAACAACHSTTGADGIGPHLDGVVGRKAGSVADYNYSDAIKNAGFTWDPAHLDTWIAAPRAMFPGAKMSFVGLKDPKDRTDVIAYLMVNSAPKPK
jgi:cytochrome c